MSHKETGPDPAKPPVAKTGNRTRPREAAPTRPTLTGSSGRTMTGPRAEVIASATWDQVRQTLGDRLQSTDLFPPSY